MAENNIKKEDSPESPNFSFGIQDTMEMGMGSQELLNDLMAPESASGNPDELTPVVKEVEEKKPEPVKKPKIKEIKEETEEEEEGEKKQNALAEFLEQPTEDDEEQEEGDKPVVEKPKEEETEETPTSQFTALSKDLYKLGVFTPDDEDEETPITTAQEFLDKFQSEKKKGAAEIVQNFIAQFGEEYQNMFEAVFVKGASPREYLSTYESVVNYAQLDMSKEDNQEKVVKQALTDQGFDPEDIVTEIDRLKNYGDLETVATKHHKVLVKKEALKLQQIEQQAERDLQQKTLTKNQYIQNVQSVLQEKIKTKEFDGIPINPKLANELQDFLLVDKWKTPTGETLTDFDRAILELKRPENHATKVKLALLMKILEKDPTLSTIQRSGVTKQSDGIFSEVVKQKTKTQTKSGNKPVSWFLQQ